VLALAVWFGFSAVVAMIASAAGRNGIAWFVLSVMISPVLAVVGLFMVPEHVRSENSERI
jgi:hypothetical protein